MKKFIITLVFLLASCGLNGPLSSPGSDYDGFIKRQSNNVNGVKGKIKDTGNHVSRDLKNGRDAISDKGTEVATHTKAKGRDFNQYGLEKHEAAKTKGIDNSRATESKFHETKDSMTKRATGLDRDAQNDRDDSQDELIAATMRRVTALETLSVAHADTLEMLATVDADLISTIEDLQSALTSVGDRVNDLEGISVGLGDLVTRLQRKVRKLKRKVRRNKRAINELSYELSELTDTVDDISTCSMDIQTGWYYGYYYEQYTITCEGGTYVDVKFP